MSEKNIDIMSIKSKELEDFISSTIDSVTSGLKGTDYIVAGAIEFELAVVKVKKKGVGIRIYVVDASAKYDKKLFPKSSFKLFLRIHGSDVHLDNTYVFVGHYPAFPGLFAIA